MSLKSLLREARACTVCQAALPLGARPVLQAAPGARVLIVGQAPGSKVHATGMPWNDASGDRLRAWLQIDPDAAQIWLAQLQVSDDVKQRMQAL